MVLYKQSWGSERELVVGKAKKAGWLVKTEVGGKTWKLKREITDV